MVTVAVAGGLGHLGQTIVERIQRAQLHNVIVLARKVPPVGIAKAPVVEINYNDPDGLAEALQANNVHTVISAIGVYDRQAALSECQLVNAASKSESTSRFIASDWGFPVPAHSKLPQREGREMVCDALRKSSLEWTRFMNGFFLDYYGMPHVESYMRPTTFVVDMQNKLAAIPGDGNNRMTWTHTHDVADFVAASLDLPSWKESTYCYGDKMSWNDFVKLVEEVTESPFTVTYDDIQKLERGEITELPGHLHEYENIPKPVFQALFAEFAKHYTEDCFDLPDDQLINHLCPQVKPRSVKDIIQGWKRQEA